MTATAQLRRYSSAPLRRVARLLALLCLFAGLARPAHAAIEDHRRACNEEQIATIAAAIKAAKLDIALAITRLEHPDKEVFRTFARWFGFPSPEATAQIIGTLKRMWAFKGMQQYWCVQFDPLAIPDEFNWEEGDLAAILPQSPKELFITSEFFSLQEKGRDSEASTIYHELAHQAGANHEPEEYAIVVMEKMAQTESAKARRHAQSIEYFITDLLYGISPVPAR